MTKFAFGLLTAGALSLAALSAPAMAAPAHPAGIAAHHSMVKQVKTVRHHKRHCTVKNVVERRHGKRIVKKVRVCR